MVKKRCTACKQLRVLPSFYRNAQFYNDPNDVNSVDDICKKCTHAPLVKRKVEAVVEAIIKFSGYLNPESPLYPARNPGGLRAFVLPDRVQESNDEGLRVFNSVIDGLSALIHDVEFKLVGRSSAHLTPTHTLTDLAEAYGQPFTAAQAWSKFMRHALRDPEVTAKTPLSYFFK